MGDKNGPVGWSEVDSQYFIDYGAYFVPERETQINTICNIIPTPPENSFIVDICCGEGLLSAALAKRFRNSTIVALDGSPTMLGATERKLRNIGGRWLTSPMQIEDDNWRHFDQPVHAFVSSLAVHHLAAVAKARLFRDLASELACDGVLVICDLVEAQRPEGLKLWEQHWDDSVRQRSMNLDGTDDMLHFFRNDGWNYYSDPDADPVDMPSGLFEQLKWMEEAGFVDVDLHWLQAGHAIFSGRKP